MTRGRLNNRLYSKLFNLLVIFVFTFYVCIYRVILDRLSRRMQKSKSIIEKIYIHFEMAKYYIKIKNLRKANLNASYGVKLAEEANSQTWICNLTILTASIDFRLKNKAKCCNELKTAFKIACTLNVPGVKQFLETVNI